MTSGSRPPLPRTQWLEVVERTPLVSIDLIVQSAEDRVLLGWRNNEPARGTWFVPGGIIRKNESLNEAFLRIAQTEIGLSLQRESAHFFGVFEHLYQTNFADTATITTHYVVLAYVVRVTKLPTKPNDSQHRELAGFTPAELLVNPQVHEHTKAYFRGPHL